MLASPNGIVKRDSDDKADNAAMGNEAVSFSREPIPILSKGEEGGEEGREERAGFKNLTHEDGQPLRI